MTINDIRDALRETFFLNESTHDKIKMKALFLAGGPGCFAGDTEVKVIDGYKKIQDIVAGDKVFTINEKTGKEEIQEVNCLYEYDSSGKDMVEVNFENGETIICTADHEFLINGKWIKAEDIIK
jgi:intein/homing endonuclease